MSDNLTINLITRRGDGAVVLTLVEQGPWELGTYEAHFSRIEQRLYDCLNVVLTGQFAKRHPDALGQPAVILLDCFALPEEPLREFAKRFVEHVTTWDDLREALAANEFVSAVDFAFQTHEAIEPDADPSAASES